jgi:hypothetical protein
MIRKMVCLAFVGVLAVAPAAEARKPKPKPINNVFAGRTDQGVPAYVKVLPHKQGIEAVFAYSADCSDGQSAVLWSGARKLAAKKGRFGFKRTEDATGPEITLDGRLGKKSASGTWHVSFTIRDDGGAVTATCDSGLVNWTLPKSTLGGQTSAGYPIILDMTKKKVRTIQLVTEMKCQSGASYFAFTPYQDFDIARDGSFGDSFTDTGQPAPNMNSNLTIEVHGKIGKTKTKGTWQLKAVVNDSSGNQVDTCDSGPLTWSVAP